MGIYGTDEVIIDLAAEIDQLRAKEKPVKGPSTEALCGHHLTEATRHLISLLLPSSRESCADLMRES